MLAISLATLASPAHAQDTPLAFTNATILIVAGPARSDENPEGRIPRGTLIVQGGIIREVGPSEQVRIPANATIIDATGKTIIPGLVDTHSHVGGVGGADGSASIQPEVRVLDSINPMDSGFRRVVAGGITTMNIMPGSGHLLSGQTVYVKPRKGAARVEDMWIRPRDGNGATLTDGPPMGGIKMANGTNMLREPPFSGTRAKSAAMVRERFIKAQEYQAKLDAYARDIAAGKEVQPPARDLGLEALGEALKGTRIVHHHTHRADDIMTVLRLQREFGFRVVLHHVSEAWKVADEIAVAEEESGGKVLGSSVILVDSPGGKLEAANLVMDTCALLEKAGADVCIHTDDWINDSRQFIRSGAMAVRFGMTRAGALRALTIEGARMLDLAERVGSLEVGKDADFVILTNPQATADAPPDPFATRTLVEQTFIDGVRVFDRADAGDRLFAEGGFGAGRDQEPYMCCAPSGGFMFGGKAWGW